MRLRDAALRAVVLRAIADAVKDQCEDARVDLHDAMTDTGATQTRVELDGATIATVSLAGGKAMARVTDDRAFSDWVAREHPDETMTVVRDPFRRKLLDHAGKVGAAVTEAGEEIPGVTVDAGRPYTSVRFAAGGREAVAAAWKSGQLARVIDPQALPGGDRE